MALSPIREKIGLAISATMVVPATQTSAKAVNKTMPQIIRVDQFVLVFALFIYDVIV